MPTLAQKPAIGVAMSGGGLRAATLSLGLLRALYTSGRLQRMRYLSSNSGSSWLNSVLSFQDVCTTAKLLGDYLPPTSLTLKALRARPADYCFARHIAQARVFADYAKGVMAGKHALPVVQLANVLLVSVASCAQACNSPQCMCLPVYATEPINSVVNQHMEPWTAAIQTALLAPAGVGDANSTITMLGTRGNVHLRAQANAKAMNIKVNIAGKDPKLPYPVCPVAGSKATMWSLHARAKVHVAGSDSTLPNVVSPSVPL
jgi:hypothetical protein